MKKIISGLIIIVLSLVFIALDAAPGDVQIVLTIPAEKVADFSEGFLTRHPIPNITDPGGSPGDVIPQYTQKEWIKVWLKGEAMKAYKEGKAILANKAAVIDPNMVDNW